MPDDSDYYGSGGDTAPDPKSQTPDPANDPAEGESETALLPKSIFGDKTPEVGDTCTFKVEHIYEDEVEVSYVPQTQDAKPKTPSSMDAATSAFDNVAQSGSASPDES